MNTVVASQPTNPPVGFKTLILGGTGTGKTTAIQTLPKLGFEVFVVFTENGMGALRKTDPAQVHWHYVRPAEFDIASMVDMATKINTMDFKTLAGLTDPNKRKHGQFIEFLNTLANFKCDRTGKTYGPIDQFGTDKVVVLDSLSGISLMAMSLVVGGRPTASEGDWGVAMSQVEKVVNNLCLGLPTNFVMMSHLERETDPVTGGQVLTASTLGRKLAPKLPRYFDDVIVSYREIDKFYWSTMYPNSDAKGRFLGLKDKAAPDFAPIVSAWRDQATA